MNSIYQSYEPQLSITRHDWREYIYIYIERERESERERERERG